MLSDKTIRKKVEEGNLDIDYYVDFEKQLQPASFDFQFGNEIAVPKNRKGTSHHPVDLKDPNLSYKNICIDDIPKEHFTIKPGQFFLGSTIEKFTIPNDIVGKVEGRSTFGRLGLIIHATAGFVDPGFVGQITLEMYNLSPNELKIFPGQLIGQMTFQRLDKTCDKPYGEEQNSKYQKQEGVTEPKIEGNI